MRDLRHVGFRSQAKKASLRKKVICDTQWVMNLEKFIRHSGKNESAWAREHGVQKDAVYRHIAGKRVSYETALRLSAATGGAITVETIYRVGR